MAGSLESGVRLTVLVLGGGRPDELDRCLQSITAADLPDGAEVLVALNGPQPALRAVTDRFEHHQWLRVAQVGRHRPGAARNAAVALARGEIVHFIDDDVMVHPQVFTQVLDAFSEDARVVAVGGPNLTPPHSTLFQWTSGAVLGSALCALPVRRRYSTQPARDVNERSLILCNLAVRRDVLEQVPFDVSLVCAEENAFLRQAARHGGRFRYLPTAAVYHERRGDLRSHLAQMRKYGYGRAQLMRRDFAPPMVVFLAPAAVTGLLVSTPLLLVLPVGSPLFWAIAAPAAAYVTGVAATSVAIGARLHRARAAGMAAALLPLTHLSYGAGVVAGLVARRRATVPTPYWDSVTTLDDSLPRGWRRHALNEHLAMVREWAPTPSGRWLKTDLYEELDPVRALIPHMPDPAWVGMDVSPATTAGAVLAGPRRIVADVRHLPFRDGAFDGVVSSSTLDHFSDEIDIERSLVELHRVLGPGGQLVLTLDNPDNPFVRIRNALPRSVAKRTGLVPFEVGRTLSEPRGRRLLEKLGFEVRASRHVLHAPFVIGTRLARSGWYERRVLPRIERVARTPLSRWVGHFVAFHAVVPPPPETPTSRVLASHRSS